MRNNSSYGSLFELASIASRGTNRRDQNHSSSIAAAPSHSTSGMSVIPPHDVHDSPPRNFPFRPQGSISTTHRIVPDAADCQQLEHSYVSNCTVVKGTLSQLSNSSQSLPLNATSFNDLRDIDTAAFPYLLGKSLLVVDDTSINRKMMARLFKKDCYKYMEAVDGQDALMLFTTLYRNGDAPHVILMDAEMPNMDGPTATKEIRTLGYKGIIIGITGSTHHAEIANFLSHGADRVLSKPLDLNALENILKGTR